MHMSGAPNRFTVLVIILCSEASEDCTTAEGVAQSVYVDTTSCSVVGFDHLVESQEGLETEVGPRADLVGGLEDCSLFWPVTWECGCLVIERSYGSWLVLTTRCWKLPSCVRTPYVGSSISVLKATKEKCFLMTLHEPFS
ncbi:hypothetical protein M9H77_17353 [Catharanthus roseus]|uniref:Uncharacterized protein n=1 Tax=Catharanthus roseus TaxID=4058 RepID=A0ACC0B4D4_CATRO|nr:hypothetical protein M9H77_17353 [Catharanthus roseus]